MRPRVHRRLALFVAALPPLRRRLFPLAVPIEVRRRRGRGGPDRPDGAVRGAPEPRRPRVLALEGAHRSAGAWEPVVGIAGRGYPLGLLDRYEVVNDVAARTPYVVARCPLAGLAAVYDRRVGGRTLTFINSGALWRDTLVLEDRETGTLWTAATGEALYGPLRGERLTPIPATNATMNAFAESNPRARYLDTGELTETSISMSLYNSSGWQGFSGFQTKDRSLRAEGEGVLDLRRARGPGVRRGGRQGARLCRGGARRSTRPARMGCRARRAARLPRAVGRIAPRSPWCRCTGSQSIGTSRP